MNFVTLLSDGAHGGWAFGPRADSTPPRVHAGNVPHVTVPLCDPESSDALTVARATITLDAEAAAAFTVPTQPSQAELPMPAVLIVTVPEHRLAVAIGIFTDTYAAHQWWAKARKRLTLPGMAIGVYPLIDTRPEAR